MPQAVKLSWLFIWIIQYPTEKRDLKKILFTLSRWALSCLYLIRRSFVWKVVASHLIWLPFQLVECIQEVSRCCNHICKWVGCAFEWLVSVGDDLSLIAGPASLDERLQSWKQVHCPCEHWLVEHLIVSIIFSVLIGLNCHLHDLSLIAGPVSPDERLGSLKPVCCPRLVLIILI